MTSPQPARPKYYVLEMFPYPSGRIHMGHVRNYTLGDVVARFKRAKGFNVLHPMGWDAFGLPAENAAIERKVHPEGLDLRQHRRDEKAAASRWACRSTGRANSRPAIRAITSTAAEDVPGFPAAGLAEREKRKVNWDPVDMTVLANEQVIDGRGWRSGAWSRSASCPVVLQDHRVRQELLDALETLDRWPDKVRLMQRNWIGRSRACWCASRSIGDDAGRRDRAEDLHDAAGHAVRRQVHGDLGRSSAGAGGGAKNPAKLAEFIAECKRIGTAQEIIETAEKQGFDTGVKASHPFDPELEAAGLCRQFRADGIRHRRDLRLPGARPARPRFRQQIRPAVPVVAPRSRPRPSSAPRPMATGRMSIPASSTSDIAGRQVAAAIAKLERGNLAQAAGHQVPPARLGHLAPALLGLPDPGHPLPACGVVPVPEQRPCRWCCPRMSELRPSPATRSTIIRPGSTSPARLRQAGARETDTFDTFVDSSPGISRASAAPRNDKAAPTAGRRLLAAGRPVYRRHRARDPASALCPLLHPRDEDRPSRFGRAVRRPVHPGHGDARKKLRQLTHRTIDAITTAFETFSFNLAVARAHELAGALAGETATSSRLIQSRFQAMETLARLIAPMVPHVAESINRILNPGVPLIATQPWPKADPALLVQDEVTIAVQVNGKLRGTIIVPLGAPAEDNIAVAKQAVAGALNGQTLVKEIYVPDRIVNFVVKP
jgi:hypothetical protein